MLINKEKTTLAAKISDEKFRNFIYFNTIYVPIFFKIIIRNIIPILNLELCFA